MSDFFNGALRSRLDPPEENSLNLLLSKSRASGSNDLQAGQGQTSYASRRLFQAAPNDFWPDELQPAKVQLLEGDGAGPPGFGARFTAVDATLVACRGRQGVVGRVRSWKQDCGFFVAPEYFEGDLFAHIDDLGMAIEHPIPGARFVFDVGQDAEGWPTATNARCITSATEWMGSGMRLRGRVRSWCCGANWGFVVALGGFLGELYLHLDNFAEPLDVDDVSSDLEVTFTVEQDRRGRLCAQKVCLVFPPAEPVSGAGAWAAMSAAARREKLQTRGRTKAEAVSAFRDFYQTADF